MPAPGKSLRSAAAGPASRKKVEIKNCQSWVFDYVQYLVQQEVSRPRSTCCATERAEELVRLWCSGGFCKVDDTHMCVS